MVGGYGELAFQFGMIDENQKAFIETETQLAISHIQSKDFFGAFKVTKLDLFSTYEGTLLLLNLRRT